jgi:hypothetical protein
MTRLLALTLLLCAGGAQAAIWPSAAAPCNGTLQACINGTAAGGAVLIRSSATINEELVINKSFSLFAAPGYRPKLATSRSVAASAPPGTSYFLEIRGIDLTLGRLTANASGATDATITLERVNVEQGVFAASIEVVGGSGTLTLDISNCRIRKPANVAEPGQRAIGIAALGSQARVTLLHNRIDIDESNAGAAIRLRTSGNTYFNAVGNDIRGRNFMAGINAVQMGAGSVLNANFLSNVVRGQAGGIESPGALSIKVDAGTARVVMRHNTLVRNQNGIALSGAGSLAASSVDRNIIAWNTNGLTIPPSQQGQVSVDNNLFHANGSNAYIGGSANLAADPQLISSQNLRPAAGSPALGAGTFASTVNPLVTLPELDADGLVLGRINTDLGAYQRHGIHRIHRAVGGSGTLSGPGIPAGGFVPFVVSQNWNPDGGVGVYNNVAIGLSYGSFWQIFNQNFTALPANSAFNIFVPSRNSLPFQDASTSTSSANAPFVGIPAALRNDSSLFWLFTLNRKMTPTVGALNPHPVALLYFGGWSLHNTDDADFPQNASYSLYWQQMSPNAYVHYVSAANRSGNTTTLDHPLLNGNPCALVQFSASTAGGVFNPHELGVYYTGSRWALFNQDGATLADDVAMNVLVDPAQAEFCDRIFADGYE